MRIVQFADVRKYLADQGADPLTLSPEEFTAFMQAETAKRGKVVKASGAQAD